MGPRPTSERGGAGERAGQRQRAQWRDSVVGCFGRRRLYPVTRLRCATGDRDADARYLRAVGATLRIAVQVWADIADETRPLALAIRLRCSVASATRFADRAGVQRAHDS